MSSRDYWHVTALATALSVDASAANSRVARLRRLADHLDAGLASPRAAALGLFQLDTATVASLRAAATRLNDLARGTPAPQQVDRDSPSVNTAEGRLFFAMRPLWDDLAEAREDGATALLLTVSPTLLRGLDIRSTRKPGG